MILTLSSVSLFTSCDDDVDQAIALSGQWYGDFGMCYYWTDGYGREYRFDSYDTNIIFYPEYDYATYGYGKQVDYYDYGPYTYQYYYFYWELENGVLYLTYPYDSGLNTYISDYAMNSNYFSGYIGDSNTRFTLYKLVDYYDWSSYSEDYSYGWNSDYYYLNSRSSSDINSNDSLAIDTTQIKIRRGNRFMMNNNK